MDQIMGNARESRPVSVQVLLIALTIQGCRPDAHVLASPGALNLAGMFLMDLEPPSDDGDPADEVFGPAGPCATSGMREVLGRLARAGYASPRPIVPLIGSGASWFSSLPSPIL